MIIIRAIKPGLVFLFVALMGCNSGVKKEPGKSNKESLVVFAASGARAISDEICNLFEASGNYSIDRSYASSGMLARQIANGAKADVFVSANYEWIEYLLRQDYLDAVSIIKIASNSLVLVAPPSSEQVDIKFSRDFNILSVVPDKIAIGDPFFVPVGKYSKMLLDSLAWFDVLKDKMILAKDVSSTLHYAELGACDWAIVYYTEAIQSSKVRIIAAVPEELHSPIYFYLARIKSSGKAGTELCHFFAEHKMKSIYEKYGFKYLE